MVNIVERKESKVSWGLEEQFEDFKMNCLALYDFWCKQDVLVQAEDLFDVLD